MSEKLNNNLESSNSVHPLENMPSFEEHLINDFSDTIEDSATESGEEDTGYEGTSFEDTPDLTPSDLVVPKNAEVTQEQNDAANLGNEGYVVEGNAAQIKAREEGIKPGENNYSDDEEEAKIASGEF